MWFFYAVALPLVALAIWHVLRYMPAADTSLLVKANVGLAWLAALSTLVLVPTDVAEALQGSGDKQLLAWWWRISYWYSFLAMFTLLPIHQEYADSGHFHFSVRLAAALRSNLMFYVTVGGVGGAGLLLLLATGELQASNVAGLCIALSNAFGLMAGIFLMGYGLVAVPKLLWRTADVRGRQRLLFHRAGTQIEKAAAAHKELSVAMATVTKVSGLFPRRDPLRRYMDEILRLANERGTRWRPAVTVVDEDTIELDYFDARDLGGLRRRLRHAIEGYEREREIYLETVRDFFEVEDVLRNSAADWGAPFVSTLHREVPAGLAVAEWWWKCVLRGWVMRLLAVVCTALTVAVLLAEVTISPALPNISLFSRILHRTAASLFLTELLCFLMLVYPCACAYYALYRLGRFQFYLLVPRHTAPFSLLANALLMCRFSAPLAFNFLAALALPPARGQAVPDVDDTVFYQEFGRLMMRQPLIGFEFTTYAPLALVPYVLLLMCNVFNRLAALFTKQMEFEDDWETKSGAATAGVRALRTELDNYVKGLPLGLTIAAGGAQSDVESLMPAQPQRSWFGWGAWRPADSSRTAAGGDEAATSSRTPAVLDARDRLARAVGRVPVRTKLFSDSHGGDEQAGLLLNPHGQLSPPSARSSDTGARTSSDLNSIFRRMESQQEEREPPEQAGSRGPRMRAIDVASDDGAASPAVPASKSFKFWRR